MIHHEHRQYFEKLGIASLLDLALIIPKSYNDTRLSSYLKAEDNFVCEAKVISTIKTPKKLQIQIYLLKFDKYIEVIYFKYSYYHLKFFVRDSILYLQGKLEFGYNKFTLIQPKILNEYGKIEPKYGLKKIKDITLIKLFSIYLDYESLKTELKDEKIAQILYEIHFPKNYQKEFSSLQIEAIKYLEIFNFLKKMSAKKSHFLATKKLNNSYESFISSLPFKLTIDQLKVIKEISEDLNSTQATKRIVVGDVGCGKSVVAFCAAYIAYPNRATLMAPTSVLANQLYNEAKKFLPFMNIALLTNSSKPKELQKAHFIIGTHALLYEKELPLCDLVMIDEQHRFGTNQRDYLKSLFKEDEKRPHFLQFSATPIPRTQAMIESSLIDISTIKEIPIEKEIKTQVISKEDFKALMSHIDEQILDNKQVAIIYPLVEQSEMINYQSIQEAKEFWQKRYQNTFIVHGKSKDKDEILKEFEQKGDVLLATTVVEVGISLPRLSTIVIVASERLGLSTLHQLRGRVARNSKMGWCYLYTNDKKNRRLLEFSKLKSGFDVAELDLKYRKSGDLLSGKMQSGDSFLWIDLASDMQIIQKAKANL